MKLLPAAVALILLPSAGSGRFDAAGSLPAQREILIVAADPHDGRLAAAREAIGFWNDTLGELGLPIRLHEAQVLRPATVKPFENYTRQIWMLAGKPAPPERRPPPPDALTALGGDIVVFFSSQVIFSFAWPFEESRFFLGVQTDDHEPLTFPNVARNVIAHELGHTFGLAHNGNTPTLMCGPCQHTIYRSDEPRFFPLTAAERARLKTLYPAR